MCTLIIGRNVLAPDTLILAANRDERPERPSQAPVVLSTSPRVVGGRDEVAGGTWLAVREGRAVVAMLNRRDTPGASAEGRRSRGLLALDVATAPALYALEMDPSGERRELLQQIQAVSGPGLPNAALCRAFAALWADRYAPFSMFFATAEQAWLLSLDAGGSPRVRVVPNGWHVLTHSDVDDELEPRTARLLYDLAFFRPLSAEKAEQRLGDLMRSHGQTRGAGGDSRPVPPVCLHDGPMVTVSSSIVLLTRDHARLLHTEGRPCEQRFADHSGLLAEQVGA